MEVYKLQMCRICLAENIRMYMFANTSLQEIYEKLTDIPLLTEDSRPMLACFICYAKLKQCCRFKKKCLEADELFAQMLNEDYEAKPQIIQNQLVSSEYVITPTHSISFLDESLTESDVVKEESAAYCEGQDVKRTDSEHEYEDHTMLSVEISPQRSTSGDTPPHHSDSDSEDDLPLMEFKIEGQEVSRTKRRAGNTTSTPSAKKPKLEDSITSQENDTARPDSETIGNFQNLASEAVAESKEPSTMSLAVTNGINVTATEKNHSNKVYNYCFNCKLSFSTSFDLIQHIRIHTTDKNHKCKICKQSFDSETNLKTHLQSHTHKILRDFCHGGSGSKSNLLKHSRFHSSEKRYECDICKRSYKGKNDLRKHIEKHTRENVYKCEICGRCFSKKKDLSKHLRIHNGGKPYKCEICQSCYSQKSGLKRHILLHTGEKPFSCDKCELSFRRSEHLKKHQWSHSSEKPFQCDYCGKFHLDKTSLKYHIQTHTAEKPYKCEICQRLFRNKVSKSHMEKCSEEKSIKLPTGTHFDVKSFKCDVCDRSYATKSILKFHIKTHAVEKPYKCDVCQRSFSYAHHLKDHILIHTGEKPYKCEICQSGFNKSSYLKVHMRAHTGEKPYQCDVCLRFFTRTDNLKQHSRTHTGEAPVRRRRVKPKSIVI